MKDFIDNSLFNIITLHVLPAGEQLETITLEGRSMIHKTLNDLQRGIEYEIRVAGRNHINFGEEAVKYYITPEAPPSGPPTNITYR